MTSSTQNHSKSLELSFVMPCLNEEETLEKCILKAQSALRENKISGEIIIADNGSTDSSISIAEKFGARVVHVREKGYGSALRSGIQAANGKFVIMGDADDSYDFLNIMPFMDKLRHGYQLVMGNRFLGGIEPGAMPFLHKYLGNPVLSFIGRLFFPNPCRDFHCGLRGFTKDAFEILRLQSTGMEFASEMVVKASLLKLKIAEVPTTLSVDGRSRSPHLRTWRDGWRHLRFLFIYSPNWLFLYPGLLMLCMGLLISAVLLPGPLQINNIGFDISTLLYASIMILLGNQVASFGLFAKAYSATHSYEPSSRWLKKFKSLNGLEAGLVVGVVLCVAGLIVSILAVGYWQRAGFSNLNPSVAMRMTIPGATALALGTQLIFSSFFMALILENYNLDDS